MANHIPEQTGGEMPVDSVQSICDVQNEDIQTIVENEEDDVDYSGFTRAEMTDRLRQLLDNGDIDTIREEIETIRFHFYRKLKAEQELKLAEQAEIEVEGGDNEIAVEEDEQEVILKELLGRYREIRNVQNEQLEAEKQKNLEEKLRIIEELKNLAKGSESISETFQQFRGLQNRWRAIGLVPQNEVKNLWDTYHHFVELFYDYIKINKDLRDLDFKRNLDAKIVLCEKTEALLLEPSIVDAFQKLQTYHEQWRDIGPVSHETRVEIWDRFKAISTQINKKHQEYFDGLKEEQNKNKEDKELLCVKLEEIIQQPLTSTNQWTQASQEIIEIQKLWNTIGLAGKKEDNRLFKRFRALCDKFFNTRREFTEQKVEEQKNNLQLKQDICVQAEALKDSTDWKATTDAFLQLQNKWKDIGAVPHKYSEPTWNRFRKACNYFFEQKASHFASVDTEYDNNLKTKRDLLNQIKKFEHSNNPKENFEQLKDLQRQWSDVGYVPMKHKKKIQDEYRNAINKQFNSLQMDDGERNRMQYMSKIETLVAEPKSRSKLNVERSRLAHRKQQLQSDLVVWENNIGFFSKSKKTEAMVANVQRMIEQAKAEMKDLEEKIRMIDAVDAQALS